MRVRKEIEDTFETIVEEVKKREKERPGRVDVLIQAGMVSAQRLQLEVLLDIRDLLRK